MSHSKMCRMTIDVPAEDHTRLKALAAVLGMSMRELILGWMQEHLYSSNSPNKETLNAIENIEKGKNLVEAKDAEDLFRKLGI